MKKGKVFFVADSDGKLVELIGVYVDEKSIAKGEAEFKVAKKFAGVDNVPHFEDITIFGGRKSNGEEVEEVEEKAAKKKSARSTVKRAPINDNANANTVADVDFEEN